MCTRRWARAALAAACMLAAAAPHLSAAQELMSMDERETCWGALDVLRGCSAGMVYHDLQQHCCIPFHALEGMDCLCGEGGEGFMGAAIDTLMPAVIDGLAACGVESPFTRMYRKQDACTKRVPQVAMPAVDEEDIFLLPEDEGDDWFMAPQITSGLDQGAIGMAVDDDIIELPADDISDTTSPYYEVADDMDIDRLWDLLMTGPIEDTVEIPEEQGVSVDIALDGGRDTFTVSSDTSLDVALYDGVLSISDETDTLIYDGVSQVTVSVPDDVDVDFVLVAAEEQQPEPELVLASGNSADAAVFNADFADVGGMKQLIGQWMGGVLGDASEDRMDRGDHDDSVSVAGDNQSLVGGLSRFLAEILAKLETAYGGAPLDVEISYEMDDDDKLPKGETEIDIEIDPELVPALTPQFLDERLRALSERLRRPARASPVRVSDLDFLQVAEELPKQAPTLSNCFNTGLCAFLCKHRRMLQYALGVETVLLVALFAFYARITRQAAQQGLECDEESLTVPLIEHAADYAEDGSGKASPLWTLTTKVSFEKQ
ncbi:g1597 [Coccomyxa elongata]